MLWVCGLWDLGICGVRGIFFSHNENFTKNKMAKCWDYWMGKITKYGLVELQVCELVDLVVSHSV